MSAYLFAPLRFQPLDGSGNPYPGALLRFQATTTTTPLDCYTDATMMTPHAYPVEAGSDGKFPPIYLSSLVAYRAVLNQAWTDPPTDSIYGSLIDDIDPISVIEDVPGGTVVMFMGSAVQRAAAYPSALWTVCDGTNSSYDMRNRAPVGAGDSYATGDAVGAAAGTTSSQSDHNHAGATGSTAADLAAHRHFISTDEQYTGAGEQLATNANQLYLNTDGAPGGDTEYILRGTTAEDATVGRTSSAGSGGGHTHTISNAGGHSHTVDTLSPSRALWFVMRKF